MMHQLESNSSPKGAIAATKNGSPTKRMIPSVLNNIAIHEMNAGDFKTANELFDSALSHALMVSTREGETKKGTIEASSSRTSCSWSNDAPVPRRPEERQSFGTFVFSRGMFVTEKSSHGDKFPVARSTKAVIIYNAALAAHLLAIETHDSNKLRKAHTLYRISKRILVLSHTNRARRTAAGVAKSNVVCCQTIHFLHMAILNNLGQLSYELAEFELCKNCFDQLQKHLNVVMTRKDKHFVVYGKNVLRGMIANSMLQTPTTAPCA